MKIQEFVEKLEKEIDGKMLCKYDIFAIEHEVKEDEDEEKIYTIMISNSFNSSDLVMFDIDDSGYTAYNVIARGGLTFCMETLEIVNGLLDELIIMEAK